MDAIGIIVEYNPFHNGHLYHLNEVKRRYPDSIIIAIMSGNYMQRGQVSLISKWEKTNMALFYGVDIVLDLPFVFSNESADYFANNAIKILNNFRVKKIVFGCETADASLYVKLAKIQLYDDSYNEYVKSNMKSGLNYPTACSKALEMIGECEINLPNDILGLAYTKSIIANGFDIEIDLVERTNSFHSTQIQEISSATSIRHAIIHGIDYDIAVPKYTFDLLSKTTITTNEDFFKYLRYKIISSTYNDIRQIHLVNEGLEYKIKKGIEEASSFNEFVMSISSKRYTYSRVSRIMFNILINYTKEENKAIKQQSYYRVLGFSKPGQKYLKLLKCQEVLFYTNIKNIKNVISDIEYRAGKIFSLEHPSYIENSKVLQHK